MRNGGFVYLQHYIPRFLLWRNDYAPLNYVRFLDYGAERVFPRKVGGDYIFAHRLLMEYFADIGEKPRPSNCGKTYHIQWLCFFPARSSEIACS